MGERKFRIALMTKEKSLVTFERAPFPVNVDLWTFCRAVLQRHQRILLHSKGFAFCISRETEASASKKMSNEILPAHLCVRHVFRDLSLWYQHPNCDGGQFRSDLSRLRALKVQGFPYSPSNAKDLGEPDEISTC
jgi:hypothetical protein